MKPLILQIALLSLLIPACVTSTEPTTVPTTGVTPSTLPVTTVPTDVDTLTIGTTRQLTNVDSADAYLPHDWEVLGNIGQGLMSFSPGTTELGPGISESVAVTNDGSTYTFRLRQGVAFPDGTELTAAVYEHHLNRMLGLDPVDGGGRSLGEPFIASVEASDRSITFTLRDPSGFFAAIAAGVPYHPSHPGMPADEVTPLPPAPVYGVGPWIVSEYEPGNRTVLEPNPLYGEEQPHVERIIVRYFGSQSQVLDALIEGSVDVAWPITPPFSAESLPAGVTAFPSGTGPIRVLVVNHALAPTDSQAVRAALAAAVDREALAAALGAGGRVLRSPIPPGFLGASEPFPAVADPESVAQLLAGAGFSRTEPLQVNLGHPADRYGDTAATAVSVVAQQWEATGLIEVESQTADWDTYISQLLAGNVYTTALLGWTVDYYDPNPFIEPFTALGGLGTNVTDPETGAAAPGLSRPELLGLVAGAAAEVDQAIRLELYEQIQDLWADDVVTIPLWWEPAWVAYRDGVTADQTAAFAEALNIGPTGFLDYTLLRSG